MLASVGRDLTQAWRRLRSSPVFTTFAVASLAIGIGVTTAIYSVLHTALAPPPGIQGVDEIISVSHSPRGSGPMMNLSLPDFEDYRARQTTLQHVAAFGVIRPTVVVRGQTLTAFAEIVSGDYFPLLGVRAALGRLIQPADDQPNAPPVVVLGWGAWQRLFAGGEDALNAAVAINGRTFVVVGVAAREFKGQFNNGLIPAAAWVPLSSASVFSELGAADDLRDRESRWLRVEGRLPAGSRFDLVRADVTTIAGQLDKESPIGTDITDRRLRAPYAISRPWTVARVADVLVNPGADPIAGGLFTGVMVSLGLVLLVVCTNLANLMLARGSARRHELAVRLALGASRGRLVMEGAIEGVLLSVAGGAIGLGIARALTAALASEIEVGNGATLLLEPRIDLTVLAVSAGATLLALVTAGFVPAWLSVRGDVRGALATDNAQSSAPRWRGRRLLIAGQVAVSVVLLAVTALFVSQVRAMSRIDSGLDLDRIAVAEVDFALQHVDDVRTRQVVASVLGQMAHGSGVEATAVSSGLPVGLTTPGGVLRKPDGQAADYCAFLAASPSIFRTLGVSILAGRAFDDRDRAGTEPVVVINETAARKVFGRADVVGRQVTVERRRWVGQDPQPAVVRTVIGVASDSDAGGVGRREQGVIYLPFEQQFEGRLVFSVRTSGDPSALVGDLRRAIAAAGPDVGVTQIGTGTALAGPSTTFGEIVAGVSGILGGFGLLLVLAGLYGVLSHIVSRRTREIGVRRALGATAGQIQRLVLREGLTPVALGVATGAALAVLARLSLQPMFERLVPALDVVALGLVPLLLFGAGALAAALPARRAARVDPNVALREL